MIIGIFALFIILVTYSPWFALFGTLSSGDWPYLFLENIREFSFTPMREFLWLAPYYQIPTKIFIEYLHIPWEIAERILWFLPFLILSILSSYYLTKSWIGVLLYTANTYILMVVGGGQMGIAMAYSIAPFILKRFINFIDLYFSLSEEIKNQSADKLRTKIKNTIKNSKLFRSSIFLGLLLSVLTMFDPRIAYICMIAILLYSLLGFGSLRKNIFYILYFIFYIFVIPVGITVLLNSYWIIPLLVGGVTQEHRGLGSVAGFEFLSFADFSNTLSLLHPNWPENIFGKVGFMKPEFLSLPILAYFSLLFISKIKNQKSTHSTSSGQKSKIQSKYQKTDNNLTMEQFNNGTSLGVASLTPRGWYSFAPRENYNFTILFFTLLGLIGAFLAKGINPPFGEINQILFQLVPGMNMFRDPTKFYVLIALSYSVLIPYSLSNLAQLVNEKLKMKSEKLHIKIKKRQVFFHFTLSFLFFIYYFLFLMHPAIFGRLGGTFEPHQVPQEYILLKNFIVRQEDSFNTLWIPKVQRYGFHSKRNQAVSADQFLGVYSVPAILKELQEPKIENTIKNLNIRYIIVPYDSQKEIFLKDRKYDPHLYNSAVVLLQKLEWIEKDSSFGNTIVFRVIE